MFRSIGTIVALIISLSGCTSMPDYAEYDDSVDYYASTERYETVSVSIDASQAVGITGESLQTQFASYLSQYGVRSVEAPQTGDAHIELKVSDKKQTYLTGLKPYYESLFPYSIDARVISDGKVVDDTTLHYVAWSSDKRVVEQQLVSMIVDDLILIWHPKSSAAWLTKKSGEPAPFALIQNDLEPPTETGATRFTWESFPSSRILEGSGLTGVDVSEVEYEIRIQHTRLRQVAFSMFPDYDHAKVFLQRGIQQPSYVPPFIMPSCDNLIWSVRAHFKSNGHSRVTEWAGSYFKSLGMVATTVMAKSTLPPHVYRRSQDTKGWHNFAENDALMHHARVGTISEVVPPDGIKCDDLDWGILEDSGRRAQGNFSGRLDPLEPGDSIGARAVIDRQCASDNCAFETGTENVTGELSACLKQEFARRSIKTPILNVSEDDPAIQGVRYILDTKINLSEGRSLANIESGIVLTGSHKATEYKVAFDASVIDTSTDEVVGTISSEHQADAGRVSGFFFILPIVYVPYGSVGEIQNKACDELARYTSFVLRGGVSARWPDEHFKTESEPLW